MTKWEMRELEHKANNWNVIRWFIDLAFGVLVVMFLCGCVWG